MTPFKPNECVIPLKNVKEMGNAPFKCVMSAYGEWHDLAKDRLPGADQGCGRIAYELRKRKDPTHLSALQPNPTIPGMTCAMVWNS